MMLPEIRDPELAEARRRDRPLIAIVILGLLIIGAIGVSAATYGRSDSSAKAATAAEANTHIAQQNTDRTECIRGISAVLDHAHWELVGEAFNATTPDAARAIGRKFTDLPLLTELAAHGGAIVANQRVRVDACPPPPTPKETP